MPAADDAMETRSTPLLMNRAGEKVWVMKVPRFLMQHMTNPDNAGVSLGTARMSESATSAAPAFGAAAGSGGSGSGSATSFTIALNGAVVPEGFPREYEMHFSAPPPATYVMSRPEDAESTAVPNMVGRVVAKGEIRPTKLTAEYRSLLKDRGDQASLLKERRSMGIVSDDREIRKQRLDHSAMVRQEREDRKNRLEKRDTSTKKRQRVALSGKELKERVMELFGKQSFWSRRDLITEVGNQQELTRVLDNICVKVTTRGAHYGDFQLKEQFRSTGVAGPP